MSLCSKLWGDVDKQCFMHLCNFSKHKSGLHAVLCSLEIQDFVLDLGEQSFATGAV